MRRELEDYSFALDSRSKDEPRVDSELGSEAVCVWGRGFKQWRRECMGLAAIPVSGRDWRMSPSQAIPGLELGSGGWLDRRGRGGGGAAAGPLERGKGSLRTNEGPATAPVPMPRT